MKRKQTVYTGGRKIPGLRFQGEMMTCIMCGKQQKSDPKVESDWTCIEVDSVGYYVCPQELAAAHKGKESYEVAYDRILREVAERLAK